MTDEPALSGVDLARVALANARAAAKNAPAQKKPRRRTTTTRDTRTGRDPVAFGDAILRMMAERGWEAGVAAGSILDQWPTIAPELAGKVSAEAFDEDTGTLALRPASDAYATQLRLHRPRVVARIQAAEGGNVVKDISILPVGPAVRQPPNAAAEPEPQPGPAPERRQARREAPEGYRQALSAHRAHYRVPAGDPQLTARIQAAAERQTAAILARRPKAEDDPEYLAQLELQQAKQPATGIEASIQAALRYKRTGQTAGGEPRRVFGAA